MSYNDNNNYCGCDFFLDGDELPEGDSSHTAVDHDLYDKITRLRAEVNDCVATLNVLYKHKRHVVMQVQTILYSLLDLIPIIDKVDRDILSKIDLLERYLKILDSLTNINIGLRSVGQPSGKNDFFVYDVVLIINFVPFKVVGQVKSKEALTSRTFQDMPASIRKEITAMADKVPFYEIVPSLRLRRTVLTELCRILSLKPYADMETPFFNPLCASLTQVHL